MNILYVTDEVQVSGATTFQTGLIPELEKKRHQVDLFLFADPAKTPVASYINLCHGYIRCEIPDHFSKKSLFKRFFILKRFIDTSSQKHDLWIVDMPHGLIPLSLVKLLNRSQIPLVFIFHGSNVLQESDSVVNFPRQLRQRFFKTVESYFYAQAQRIFVCSQFSKDVVVRLMQVPSDRVTIAFPGIDPLFAKTVKAYTVEEAKEKLGLSFKQKLFVVAGRIEPRKGILPLLQAFSSWGKGKPATLIVLSNFSELHEDLFGEVHDIEDEAKQLMFIHKPSKKKIALFFRAADCVILPSTAWETLGFVTLEALASNTPVVAFPIGANGELLNASQLVPFSNSPGNFRASIEKADSVTKSTPQKTIAHFNWNDYIETFLANI